MAKSKNTKSKDTKKKDEDVKATDTKSKDTKKKDEDVKATDTKSKDTKKKEEPKEEDTMLVNKTSDTAALKGEPKSKIIKISRKKRLPKIVFSKGARKDYR